MDMLRNLFGNVTAGIIRLLVTVGIIAAVGFFLVKPALETTEKVSEGFNNNIQKSLEQGGTKVDMTNINKTIEDVNRQVQREIRRSLRSPKQQGDADKLIRCIRRANNDVNRIQRCSQRFQ